ncbi:MAG: hypothetical protein M0P43_07110 [Arcobacteraceae bacterium]|nr:hypothetical protein [Arcobacteraceae bacterium]MDY0326791.1 hypothetical protein [Arcobacteraceae bacterium]
MKKTLFLIVTSLILISGCGYKPVSHYTKDQINGLVYVTSETSLQDPQNSVILQDSVTQIIVSNLGLAITNDKKMADTIVTVTLGKPSITKVQYDTLGYVSVYRARVKVVLKYQNAQKSGQVSSSGEYDFNIDNVSHISDTERFKAIKEASIKALDDILGKLAVESFK